MKVIVAMTSWKKRIGNVKKVVESIMKNTYLPDKVYLTLSSDEFPLGVNELPKDLVEYFESSERLEINWVVENTKSMKKIFPILEKLEDDDIIIDADDDILFPEDLIKSRLDDFEKHGRKFSISSNGHYTVGFHRSMVTVSATSLFQKKMLNNWDKFVTPKIVQTYNDDRTYLMLLWLNGWKNVGPSKHTVQELLEKYDMKLEGGMKDNGTNVVGKRYDIIANAEFEKMSGMGILKSFGYYRK